MKFKDLYNKYRHHLLVVFLFIIISILLVNHAGTWLTRDDHPHKADAIIILMGSIPDRIMHAADLYHDSIANQVLLVEEYMGGMGWLRQKGYDIHSNSEQMMSLAHQMGVPLDSIHLIPGDARSTMDEAIALIPWLNTNPKLDTLVLVSSASHMRRAGLIFNKVFKANHLDVIIMTSPSPYSNFHAKDWYLYREDIQTVLSEYAKLFVFVGVEQWGLGNRE